MMGDAILQPSEETEHSAVFFERAVREAHRYGTDPWVLLRELVQNAVDAGANTITLSFERLDGEEILVCKDNGCGMDQAHIRRYLLKLYASSKEQSQDAIGFFGVGFWSVLLFEPSQIQVFSRTEQEAAALAVFPQRRELSDIPATKESRGTRIVLKRPVRDETDPTAIIRERLIYYVGPLESPKGRPVLLFNGEQINTPFPEPRLLGVRIKKKHWHGVVALDTVPLVRLYKGGILIRDLQSLEEVLPGRKPRLRRHTKGLYPHIHLNADAFQVLMDRQKVFEDPLLYEIADVCEKHLEKLQRGLLGKLFPVNHTMRLQRLLKQVAFLKWLWVPATLILLFFFFPFDEQHPDPPIGNTGTEDATPSLSSSPGESGLAAPGGSPRRSAALSPENIFDRWQTSKIDGFRDQGPRWLLTYEPREDTLFRLRPLGDYDFRFGLQPTALAPKEAYTSSRSSDQGFQIEMGVSGGGNPFSLPVPPDYALAPETLTHSSGSPVSVLADQWGHPMVMVSQPGSLSYQVFPTTQDLLPPPLMTRYLPEPPFPPPPATATVKEKVTAVTNWVRDHFEFSRDPSRNPDLESLAEGWFENVVRGRVGDCDVINGAAVIMLQKLGVEAELVVGMVGDDGLARSELHAWIRYWDGGSKRIDMTPHLHFHNPLGNPGPVDVPVVVSETRQPEPTLPFYWIPALGLAILTSALFLWLRKRGETRRLNHQVPPDFAPTLFQSNLRRSSGPDDPLQLHDRPIFTTLSGKRKSLNQIIDLSSHSRVAIGTQEERNAAPISKKVLILDRTDPMVSALQEFLPPMPALKTLAKLHRKAEIPEGVAAVIERLREQFPDLQVWPVSQDSEMIGLFLPLDSPYRGLRHLFWGERHPLFLTAIRYQGEKEALLAVATEIIEQSHLFVHEREKVLKEWYGTV